MPIATAAERVGTTLAKKYRLDRILGEGGMGVVYAGHHLRLDRRVAVKFLHHELSRDANVVSRFFSEAQAAARMQHPNVVDVYDLDQADDGSAYMVLELLDGESLADRLKRAGPLNRQEVVEFIGPVLGALHEAHQLGIVHRDLKPDNIFLSVERNGAIVPKVLDFGVAKLADAQRSGTSTGQVVGTPAYMAPEQAMGRKDIGPWTDIWAMGVVLFEAMTWQYPFEFSSDMPFTGLLLTIVSVQPRSLRDVLPDAPAHLVLAVDRALSKDPTERWPSMNALRAAIDAAPLSQQETAYAPRAVVPPPIAASAPPPVASQSVLTGTVGHQSNVIPQRSLLVWGAAGLGLLGLVAVIAVAAAWSGGQPAAPTPTPPPTIAATTPDAGLAPAVLPPPTTPQVATTPPHHPVGPHHLPTTAAPPVGVDPPVVVAIPPVTATLPTIAEPPATTRPEPETPPTTSRVRVATDMAGGREAEADPETDTPPTTMRREPTSMQSTWGTTVSAEDM